MGAKKSLVSEHDVASQIEWHRPHNDWIHHSYDDTTRGTLTDIGKGADTCMQKHPEENTVSRVQYFLCQ